MASTLLLPQRYCGMNSEVGQPTAGGKYKHRAERRERHVRTVGRRLRYGLVAFIARDNKR